MLDAHTRVVAELQHQTNAMQQSAGRAVRNLWVVHYCALLVRLDDNRFWASSCCCKCSCSSDTHFTCEPSIHWHWGWYCFSSSNNETQLTVCRWLRAYSHSGQYHYACSSQFSTNAKRLLSAHICVMLQCFMSAAQHSTAQHFRQHPTLHDGAMTFLQDGMAWALLKTDLHLVAGLQIPLHVLHLFSQPLMLTLQVPHLCITTKRLWPLSLTAVLAADV